MERKLTNESLTSVELQGLNSDANIADGHAHQRLNPLQEQVITGLSAIYDEAQSIRQSDLESALLEAMLPSGARHLPRPILLYSASIGIHVVARFLAEARQRCVLVSPTFDNLPDLVVAQGVELASVPEDRMLSMELESADALFAVLPNNPTGVDVDKGDFEVLARMMAESNRLLVCDFSFRYFQENPYDHYEILRAAGTSFIAIEDTGKYLPALDLKVGALVFSPDLSAKVSRICEDILLNVSPFTLLLLTRLIERDEPERTHAVVRENRDVLAEALEPFGIMPRGRSKRLSVEWLELPEGLNAPSLTSGLAALGVPVLPGGPFHWDEPSRGRQFVRVALLRDPVDFRKSVDALVRGIHSIQSKGER